MRETRLERDAWSGIKPRKQEEPSWYASSADEEIEIETADG